MALSPRHRDAIAAAAVAIMLLADDALIAGEEIQSASLYRLAGELEELLLDPRPLEPR